MLSSVVTCVSYLRCVDLDFRGAPVFGLRVETGGPAFDDTGGLRTVAPLSALRLREGALTAAAGSSIGVGASPCGSPIECSLDLRAEKLRTILSVGAHLGGDASLHDHSALTLCPSETRRSSCSGRSRHEIRVGLCPQSSSFVSREEVPAACERVLVKAEAVLQLWVHR